MEVTHTGRRLFIYLNIFPVDEIRQQFSKINKRIFNQRDGEILRIQKEYGTTYKKSMGVAIISLENIAKDYTQSHELAKLFWEFNGREQTIMAAMLEEPEKIIVSELEKYLSNTNTPELWEQITKILIRKLPNLAALISKWLKSKNEILQTYAILALGYFPNLFSTEILDKVLSISTKKDSYLHKCINRILLKIGVGDIAAFELLKKNQSFQEKYADLYTEIAAFY